MFPILLQSAGRRVSVSMASPVPRPTRSGKWTYIGYVACTAVITSGHAGHLKASMAISPGIDEIGDGPRVVDSETHICPLCCVLRAACCVLRFTERGEDGGFQGIEGWVCDERGVGAWARERYVDLRANTAGAGRHDDDTVGEKDRFVHIVRDEEDGLPLRRPRRRAAILAMRRASGHRGRRTAHRAAGHPAPSARSGATPRAGAFRRRARQGRHPRIPSSPKIGSRSRASRRAACILPCRASSGPSVTFSSTVRHGSRRSRCGM